MKHFLSAHNFDYRYYYSCDYFGCTKTVNAPRKGFLMPSGWFSTGKGESKKHYCLKHYNQIQRDKREQGHSMSKKHNHRGTVMNRVIELLEWAHKSLTEACCQTAPRPLNIVMARSFIQEAMTMLQPPRWETPEQWEKRTGEKLSEDAAVYFKVGRPVEWGVCRYQSAKRDKDVCVVATEAGPPPDTWGPEEEK